MDENLESYQERSERIKKRFVVRAAQYGEEPLRWSHCTIHNLSVSGVLFTYDRPVAEGARLYLKIDFPGRVVECLGRVARIVGSERGQIQDLGVQFIHLQEGDREFIERYVADYPKK